MSARTTFSGSADGRFERVVHHLVTDDALVLEALGADLLVGHVEGRRRVVLIVRHGAPAAEVERALAAGRERGVEIVEVGGPPPEGNPRPPEGEALIRWHVAEDGTVRGVEGPLETSGIRPFLGDSDGRPDWPRFWAVVEARVAAQKEMVGFQQGMKARRAVAVPVLAGVIVAVYVLGTLWGAPDYRPALTRMGSLDRDRVLAGEVWRLVSLTFLHGSVLHLGMNVSALWSLGSLERVLGTARFLTVYVCAAIAGSVASLALSSGLAVGASGALWGLMAAEIVLAWRGQGILPAPTIAAMRRATPQNLVLNIGISLLPGVSWSAHFGGGLAGAVLAFAGALTVGLPRWAELAPGAKAPPDRVPAALRVGGWVSGVALVVSLGCALVVGRPWEVAAPPTWTRTPLGDTGWSAELPAGLTVVGTDEAGGIVLGDLRSDAGSIRVAVSPLGPPPTAEAREQAFQDYAAGFSADTTAAGYRSAGEAVRVEQSHLPTVVEQRFVYEKTLVLVRAAAVDAAPVLVDVTYWERADAGWAKVARRVAATAERGR